MNRSAIQRISILLLFSIVAALIYSNTLEVPFYFDDVHGIVDNPSIRITELSLQEIGNVAFGKAFSKKRPVGNITFALNYYFHQYRLQGYHIVNISIHLLTAAFLYFFIKTTLTLPTLISKYDHPDLIAFFATLVWLVHPIHTQSVTYIVQRLNSMAAMFFVLSLLLYVKGRLVPESAKRWFLYGASFLAGLLALGSKESAAMLPFFIFLYEWYFFQDLDRDWLKRHLKYVCGVVFLFGLIALIYMGTNPFEKLKSLNDYAHNEFTLTERVLTQPRVVIYYLSLIFFPHPSRLNLDYDFPLSHSLIDPVTTLFSLCIIFGLIGLAVYTAKKERLLSFCILWFFGNLVIESSVIPLAIIFEHRTYLPSMLVCLLAVLLGYRLLKIKWPGVALVFVVAAVFSFWTYQRNSVWQDPVVFWSDCVEKSPQKARPRNNLGLALADQNRIAEAIIHYFEALRINPSFAEAHDNLGNALAEEGRLDEAINHYTEALRINPNNAKAYNNLGQALTYLGRQTEAFAQFSKALQIDPKHVEALNSMGNALVHLGRIDEAISHYTKALRIKPDYASAHNNLGNALKHLGRLDEAVSHYSKALQLDPDNAEAHNNLGILLAEKGKADQAMEHYIEALRLNPDSAAAYVNLGIELENQGRIDQAIDHFKKALSLQPELTEAMYHLAKLYIIRAEDEKALYIYQKMIANLPDNPAVYYNIACIYSRKNQIEEAIDWLKKAIEKGYHNWDLIKTDKDLENIRSSSYYKELIKDR